MSLIVSGLLEVLAIIKRDSKFIFFLLILTMWLLMWGDCTSPDRVSYIWMYNQVQYITDALYVEFGFQKIMLIIKSFGASFQFFIATFSFVPYCLMAKKVMEKSSSPALVMALYFLFPYLLDAEQLRSFFGMALIVYATGFLEKNDKLSITKYCAICLLASTIQYSCIIFLLFLFVKLDKKTLASIVSVLTAGMFLIRYVYKYFRGFIPSFIYSKLASYLNRQITLRNVISVLFFVLIFGITIYLISKKKFSYNDDTMTPFYNVILKINIISLTFMPLVLYSEDFTRIPRAIVILNYIVISNCIKKKITRYFELLLLLVCLAIVGSRMFVFFTGGGYNSYIVPFFYEGSNCLPVYWDY